MKCRFNTTRDRFVGVGFSLIETMAALTILSIISVAILVVINRSMASATDSIIQMRAFEVARENMENLLISETVSENIEYGISEKYPEIKWQRKVEPFAESVTLQMWIRGICSAEYVDSAGEVKNVELTSWLTNLTIKDVLKIIEQREELKAIEDSESVLETDTDADTETDEQTDGEAKTDKDTDTATDTGAVDDKEATEDRPSWLPDYWDEMSSSEQLEWAINYLLKGK